MTAANPLMPSQVQVLRMLASGMTNRQIGRRLHISSTAVAMRTRRAAARLNTTTTVQTVVVALKNGYLANPEVSHAHSGTDSSRPGSPGVTGPGEDAGSD